MVLEELGPTYVKFGQVLSTRPDLVPAELLSELTKLQDRVEPVPFEAVCKVVEEEFGRPHASVFESLEPVPLASASLGQVHRAKLNGQDVVVKVQRPGIRNLVEADIRMMKQLAHHLERRLKYSAIYQPSLAVKQFEDTLTEELDYRVEAAHQERVIQQFKDDPTIRVPRVFRQASTSRILTMEYIDGIRVSDNEALRAAQIDFAEVARRGFRFVLKQTLEEGFFHADPHPGNILVLPNNVVCFIDFGMMGRLGQRMREDFVELVYHVIDGNPHRVAESIISLLSAESSVSMPELERDVARFLDAYAGRTLRELNLSKLLGEILAALAKHGLRIPPDLYLMLKAIIQIESTAVALAPEFDVAGEAEPFARKVFRDRFRPQRLVEEAAVGSREMLKLLREAPTALRELGQIIKREGIGVRFHQSGMPEALSSSDRSANRVAYAFVVGACLVGSAIIAAAKIPPTWNGVSIIGLGGFLIALVLATLMVVSIRRQGRL